MSKFNIILLIVGFLILGFCLFQLNFNKNEYINIEERNIITNDGDKISFIKIEDLQVKQYSTAIILHGHMNSKTIMKHLGIALARIGINSYIMDIPGYGKSTNILNKDELINLKFLKYFYEYLKDNNNIIVDENKNYKLALIGHSIGAETAIKASLKLDKVKFEQIYNETEYTEKQLELNKEYLIQDADTHIIIDYFNDSFISKNNPKNMFVLLPEKTLLPYEDKILSFVGINKKNSIISNKNNVSTLYKDYFNENNLFKVNKYSNSTSSTLIYNNNAITDISNWLVEFYNIELDNPHIIYNNKFFPLYILGILISVFLLFFPLMNFFMKLWIFDFNFKQSDIPYKIEGLISILFKLFISIVISSALILIFNLFKFLGIKLTDYIVSYFFYQFIINIFIFRNYLFTSAKYDKQVIQKIILGLLISLMIYFLAGTFINIYITTIWFNTTRFIRFLVVFPIFILYFTIYEFLFRTPLTKKNVNIFTYIKSFIVSGITKLFLLMPLCLIFIFYFSMDKNLLMIFIPLFAFLLIIFEFVSIYLFKNLKSFIVNAFVNAFFFGWVLCCIMPLI